MKTKLEARTLHGSGMKGTVALDWNGEIEFIDNLKSIGLDTDRFFPIAIEVSAASGGLSQSITVYAVEKSHVGDNADTITKFARENPKVPVRKFRLKASLADLINVMTEFQLFAKRSWAGNFTLEVESE